MCANASSSLSTSLSTAPAPLRVDVRAAELLLADLLADAALDDRRAGDEELARLPDHEREVRGHDAGRTEAGDRAHAGAHHRHLGEEGDDHVPGRVRGHVGALHLVERLDAAAAARAVDEADDGQPQLARHELAVALLVGDRRVGGAAADREVVAADDDTAAVDPSGTQHEVRRHDLDQAAVLVAGFAGQRARLVEGTGIEQALDALAHRELAARVLARDVLGPAHPPGQLHAALDLVDL